MRHVWKLGIIIISGHTNKIVFARSVHVPTNIHRWGFALYTVYNYNISILCGRLYGLNVFWITVLLRKPDGPNNRLVVNCTKSVTGQLFGYPNIQTPVEGTRT